MLENAKVADNPENIVCTITGDGGTGKTSFAATFPKPLFICTEDGIKSIPKKMRPPSLPLVRSLPIFWDQLKAIVTEDHDYKTVVIDSVTQLNTLFTEEILNDSNVDSLVHAKGGFGAGFNALANMHARVRRFADKCLHKGLNVVFIAHADTKIIDLPDEEPYSRYTVKLHHSSLSHYIDNVDLVGQIKLETFVTSNPKTKGIAKAKGDGTRILRCHATVSGITKNRFGITEDLVLKYMNNPLIERGIIK